MWVWLILLFGFVEPCEARKEEPALSVVDGSPVNRELEAMTPWEDDWTLGSTEAHHGLVIATPMRGSWHQSDENPELSCQLQGTEVERESSEGLEFLVGACKVFLTVAAWELLKWGACRRSKVEKTALVQTDGGSIVPLPLPDGMPNRARIIFNLWQAGFDVDVSTFPESEQEKYFSLVGNHLRGMSEDSS